MKVLLNHIIECTSPECYTESFAIAQYKGDQGLICIAIPDGDKEGVDLRFVKAVVNILFEIEGKTFETTRSDFEYLAASPDKLIRFIGHVNMFNEFFKHILPDKDRVFVIRTTQEEV